MSEAHYIINTALLNQSALYELMKYDRTIFSYEKDRWSFDVIHELYESGQDIDFPIFVAKIADKGMSKKLDAQYISEISNAGTTVDIDFHLRRLYRENKKNEIRDNARDLCHMIESESLEWETPLDRIIYLSENMGIEEEDLRTMGEFADQSLDNIFTKGRYIKSGLPSLDDKLIGFFRSNMTTIGARPGQGKTTLAMQIVIDNKIPALFFIEESKKPELYARILSHQCAIEVTKILNKSLTDDEWHIIHNQHMDNKDIPLIIVDHTLNINDIERITKKVSLKRKVDMIVVDYIQMVSGGIGGNTNERLTNISQRIKRLASKYDIPALALSQLSRDHEKSNREPVLADLRDCGSIEADSSAVIFLHEENIKIAKNRLGKIGKINDEFETKIKPNFKYYRFDDLAFLKDMQEFK